MDFLKGNIKSLYVKLLGAAVGSALVSSIFGIVDAMMVGQYHGPTGVAALSVFSPIWNIVYSLGILAGIGGSVLYANMRGAGKEQEANKYFTLSVLYGVVLAVLAMAGIGLFNELLFRFFGGDEALIPLVQQYLKPIWFAIPCCVFSNILSAYLRNDGDAPLAMKAVLCGGAFNVVGDYICVFALDMGIFGAGVATAMGQYVSTIIMLTHFIRKHNTLHFEKLTNVWELFSKVTRTGFPTAISDLSMGVVTVLFNRQVMKYLGVDALSVYGIIAQIVPFVQCCAYGAGQAAQPIISQNLGAGQYDRIKKCLKYGLYTCAVFGILWTGMVVLMPNLFVRLFMTPTEAVLEIAPAIIRTYGVSFLLVPFNIFATYYFQSMMKPNASLIASLGRGVVVSGGLILLLPIWLGADAIWLAMPITEILIAAFCVWQMKKVK